jgi:DMSO/TMAO reductase YedYZ molybdopterin-dependent catalytic subunit
MGLGRALLVLGAALALCAPAPEGEGPADPAPRLEVVGAEGRKVELTLADLAALPRAEAVIDHAGRRTRFEGALLSAVLGRVGAPLGPALRGPALGLVVLATGRDGYRAALALAEADPGMRPAATIVADREDGAPLAQDGPLRLVVAGDLRPARSVRMLVSLEVRRLGPP